MERGRTFVHYSRLCRLHTSISFSEDSLTCYNINAAIRDACCSWYALGEQLKLSTSTLDCIRKDHSIDGTVHQCGRMVNKWLRLDLEASWSKLCVALEAIGENAVACSIRRQYIKEGLVNAPANGPRSGISKERSSSKQRSSNGNTTSQRRCNERDLVNASSGIADEVNDVDVASADGVASREGGEGVRRRGVEPSARQEGSNDKYGPPYKINQYKGAYLPLCGISNIDSVL